MLLTVLFSSSERRGEHLNSKESPEVISSTGERIKSFRQKRKLSQKQLGEKVGMSQQQIGQYETGTRIPKTETLVKLAAALDCTLFDLGSWDEYPLEDQIDAIIYGGRKAEMLAKYDCLNPDEKKKVDAYVDDLHSLHMYRSKDTDNQQE